MLINIISPTDYWLVNWLFRPLAMETLISRSTLFQEWLRQQAIVWPNIAQCIIYPSGRCETVYREFGQPKWAKWPVFKRTYHHPIWFTSGPFHKRSLNSFKFWKQIAFCHYPNYNPTRFKLYACHDCKAVQNHQLIEQLESEMMPNFLTIWTISS